jgi:hypothetical protein
MSLATHLAVLAALIVDLTLGGPLVRHLLGAWAVVLFELLLIAGYLLLVLRLVPWRRERGG